VGSNHLPQLTQPFQVESASQALVKGVTNCMPLSKYRVATYSTFYAHNKNNNSVGNRSITLISPVNEFHISDIFYKICYGNHIHKAIR
jgi:hypothetical protein